MSTAIVGASSSTREVQTVHSIATRKPPASSITVGLDGIASTNVTEARYWTQKFGLGPMKNYGTAPSKYAHPRFLTVQPGASAVIHQVLFGPSPSSGSDSVPVLAAIGGPRVSLYGTSPSSPFHRFLSKSRSVLTDHDHSNPTLTKPSSKVEPDRRISTGGHLALCASFRTDGRLIAVGTDVGEIRICDITMRATLATFQTANKLPIRTVQWCRNGHHLWTGGDDGIGRIWDLSTGTNHNQTPVHTFMGHGDTIRCSVVWQKPRLYSKSTTTITAPRMEWNSLAMTGSYDHTIRVWNITDIVEETKLDGTPNTKTNVDYHQPDRCLATLSHGDPVEALCLMTSQNTKHVPVWLLSAGGTTIKIWNPLTGSCMSTIPTTHHRKTITTLLAVPRCWRDTSHIQERDVAWRIVTASLDGVLQFHSWNGETGNTEHLYSTKIPEAITSVTMDTKADRIAVGTTSGSVLVRMRGPNIEARKRRHDPRAGTYSFFQRGMNVNADVSDYLVQSFGKKRKLRSFDVALKQFRYNDALDNALATRRPRDVISVLEELGRRRGLIVALSNRDEEMLEPILSFTIRYINRPHFTSLLIGIAHKLINIYGNVAGQSEVIDELFVKLKIQVRNECNAQKSIVRLVGQMDAIIAASESERFPS